MSRRLGSMAVFVLVLVGIAAIEEASSTTFPGANGRIAFVYNPDGTPGSRPCHRPGRTFGSWLAIPPGPLMPSAGLGGRPTGAAFSF